MSLAIVHSRAQVGVQAPSVSVETHLANGLPHLTLVGLPETTVKESKDRVRSAIVNSGAASGSLFSGSGGVSRDRVDEARYHACDAGARAPA